MSRDRSDNSPMRVSQIVPEIDRYAVTPGQALAYMIGRLEIQRMRREAEKALGERFAIKGFHDAVLGSGLMPLPVLDRVVRDCRIVWTKQNRIGVVFEQAFFGGLAGIAGL